MKYYAVTDDPNELMHFGIKGMKWGILRTPEQLGHYKNSSRSPRHRGAARSSRSSAPRSAAYISTSSKLRKLMKSGIEKAKADWNEYNSPENKAYRQYKKNERLFEKHVQLARQGRLKYKGISDSEVSRITDRLALENSARAMSGREQPSFIRRVRESAANGIVQGVGQGTSGYISARMTGRGQTTAQIKGARRKARAEFSPVGRFHKALERSNSERQARAEAKNNARREIDAEYYKYAAEQGEPTNRVSALIKSAKPTGYINGPAGTMIPTVKLHSSLTRKGRAQAVRNYRDAEERSNNKSRLEYKEEELKLQAKYKKDKKGENGEKNKGDTNDNNGSIIQNPEVTQHSLPGSNYPVTTDNHRIMSTARNNREYSRRHSIDRAISRSNAMMDEAAETEWKKIQAKAQQQHLNRYHQLQKDDPTNPRSKTQAQKDKEFIDNFSANYRAREAEKARKQQIKQAATAAINAYREQQKQIQRDTTDYTPRHSRDTWSSTVEEERKRRAGRGRLRKPKGR